MENKNLTFGEATKLLKEGKAVRRNGCPSVDKIIIKNNHK